MSARTISLGGMIWASAAHTTIPTTPIAGEPYRNTTFAVADAANGWRYYRVADSADFNQFVFLMSTVLNDVEKQGLLIWSNFTDYPIGGLARDPDDGNVYEALAISGPNSGGTKQPSLYVGTYWKIPDFLAKSDGYEVIFTSVSLNAGENEQIYCNPGPGGLTVTLPDGSRNGAKIKVTTGSLVSETNQVTVSASEIQDEGNTGIIISTPMTSVQFIWDTPSARWVLGEICYPQTVTTGE